ncbi:cobalt-zinc-cadmium resistance protein CzcB [bacterium BMS3Bbin03]|nr:cobalt-zinc-cadmium resistance protein CzcB [bacterium BMS3Bbin03]
MPHIISTKQIISFIVIAAFFFILGLFISPKLPFFSFQQQRIHSEKSDSISVEQSPVAVEAEPARMGTLVMRLSATGLTRAVQEISIMPKVSGQIVKLPIQEGQFVRRGTLLLKLDDREYRLALAEAKDNLLGAEVKYGIQIKERKKDKSLQKEDRKLSHEEKDLFSEPFNSQNSLLSSKLTHDIAEILSGKKQEELIAQKTGLTAAAIAVQRAELNLSYTELRAPFSGYIADLKIKQNQQISVGREVFHLVDLSPVEVELQVLESEVGLIKEGRKAAITFPAYPDEVFHGKVTAISPLVNPKTKTVKVIVRLPNRNKKILPGMFAYAKVEGRIFKKRFLVPKEALLIRDQRKLVFIVRNGRAKWCYVKTGLENDKYVEILSSAFGLKPGELVITKGQYTLVHDQRVVVRKKR